jgi:AbrB family looped-hinge helix DNA binding protein
MMRKVVIGKTGQVTLPVEVRRCLGLDAGVELHVEIDEANDAIILRPAFDVPREDRWAYAPEHRRLLAQARRDAREGRVYRLAESDLARLGDE